MPDDRVVVGRIAKAHGIRGEVSIEVLSDAPDRFAPGSNVVCNGQTLTVEAARPHQGRLLVKFEQIPDRTAAEALHGGLLTIDEEQLHELDEWSFYPHQLEGLTVVNPAGTELGTFRDVLESPANDVWVIDANGTQVLVPAVRAVVVSVDLDGKRIVIDPPEGLF